MEKSRAASAGTRIRKPGGRIMPRRVHRAASSRRGDSGFAPAGRWTRSGRRKLYNAGRDFAKGDPMFLKTPPADTATAALYKSDMEEDGYVMNLTRLWAWRPDVA